MTIIEMQTMEIIKSNLPRIAGALVRIADKMEAYKGTCCLCGEEFIGHGNSAWPLVKTEGAKCCDSCNNMVLEARFKELIKKVEK